MPRLVEHGEALLLQVDELDVEGAVRPRAIDGPGRQREAGPTGTGADGDDVELSPSGHHRTVDATLWTIHALASAILIKNATNRGVRSGPRRCTGRRARTLARAECALQADRGAGAVGDPQGAEAARDLLLARAGR